MFLVVHNLAFGDKKVVVKGKTSSLVYSCEQLYFFHEFTVQNDLKNTKCAIEMSTVRLFSLITILSVSNFLIKPALTQTQDIFLSLLGNTLKQSQDISSRVEKFHGIRNKTTLSVCPHSDESKIAVSHFIVSFRSID